MVKNDKNNHEEKNLDDIIHEYNEDSELRRKIEQLKKQKNTSVDNDEEDHGEEIISDIDMEDTVCMNFNQEDTFGLDKAIEHTVTSERDEPLIIMNNERVEDENLEKTRIHMFDEVVKPVEKQPIPLKEEEEFDDDEDDENDEKVAKINKVIIGIILVILSGLLVFGIGYGVKTFMSNKKDEPQAEQKPDKKPDKKPSKKPNKEDQNQQNTNSNANTNDDIKDNSATINRLEKQKETYQAQLDGINKDIEAYQKEMNAYKKKQQDSDALGIAYNEAKKEMDNAEVIRSYACKLDEESQDCKEKSQAYDYAKRNFELSEQAYKENGGELNYTKEINDLAASIEQLENKKPDIELKITEIETELYNLKR